MQRRLVLAAVSAAVFASAAAAMPVMAAPSGANADVPTPSALVLATNAMLRPQDVPPAIAGLQEGDDGESVFRTGYTDSFVNDDPLPVCTAPKDGAAIFPPLTGALIYQASATGVTQYVYEYPSDASALSAWTTLSMQLQSRCRGSVTRDGVTTAASTSPVPGPGGVDGWGVTSSVGSQYSTVRLVGSGIQFVGVGNLPAADKARASAMNTLAAALAFRWLGRAKLPLTQDPAITQAARTMLQPADIPAALPIRPPAQGGVGFFSATVPGAKPTPCNDGLVASRAPMLASSQSFVTSLGGDGDPASPGNVVQQRVFVYDSPALAKRAWGQLQKALAGCEKNADGPVPTGSSFDRQVTGVSALAYDGVPGLWLRRLSIWDQGLSQKDYDITLLVGNTIQRVSYTRTITGMRQVPLDQEPVNALAEQLAHTWSDGSTP